MKKGVRLFKVFGICLILSILVVGCGSGGSGGDSGGGNDNAPADTPSSENLQGTGQNSTITLAKLLAPGNTCPNGGITVESGIDENQNGLLDAAEVDAAQDLCNGKDGTVALFGITPEPAGTNCANSGEKIETGLDTNGNNVLDTEEIIATNYICFAKDGANGISTLMTAYDEPAGANCPDGGKKIETGLDANANDILDTDEIAATNYLCNGTAGVAGSNGTDGANGFSTLMTITDEPTGANCTYGGEKIDSGQDSNNNGVLEPSEKENTAYTCNGGNWWGDLGKIGSIKGIVLTEEGIPANGATVAISGTIHYANTDSFGQYSFSNIEVGHRDITISLTGYYEKKVDRVPVTEGTTTSVRKITLSAKRLPFEKSVSLQEFTVFTGKTIADYSGRSVSSAGDVNGDGFDDILIGAPLVNSNAGETYLVYGRPGLDSSSLMSMEPDVTFTGKTADDYSGTRVSSAGDVNGDGFDDILIGAYGANSATGETYLVYGNASLTGVVSLSAADVTFTGKGANDYSGISLSSTGDVNGDGFDDILIGAPLVNYNAGETYLVYGKTSLTGSVSLSAADVTFTGKTSDLLSGTSLSSAGDVNGDGFDDILIGTNHFGHALIEETYLLFGNASLTGTISLSNADVSFTKPATIDNKDYSVSSAGDVNGDGFDDILIGANVRNSSTGVIYLIYGKTLFTSTISLSTADVTFTGTGADASFETNGSCVSSAGDVNGDGFDDILIGASSANSHAGETYLVYGKRSLTGVVSLSAADVTFMGKTDGDNSGFSVSSAGDVNGDGFDDILIGARHADPGGLTDAGETYLIAGRERGTDTQANVLEGTLSAGTADTFFIGGVTMDRTGISLSSAGDVNGDGFDDILIGAPGVNSNAGETYLVYGKPGLDRSSLMSIEPDVTFTGKGANDYSGRSLSSAGDINGDGFDDILIGAYGVNSATGETYLVYGNASLTGVVSLSAADVTLSGKTAYDNSGISVSSAGDVNGDGFDDILIGAHRANSSAGETYLVYGNASLTRAVSLSAADVTFTGKTAMDSSGLSLASAGDINGDGFDDILIGASIANSVAGETYLIYGKTLFTGTVSLSTADVTFTGKTAMDSSGASLSSAGDINGDGFDDILIGAYGANSSVGETYLVYGNASSLSGSISLSTSDVTFTGKTASDLSGSSVSSAGDINGDGFDDILIGATGTNSAAGETCLFYGNTSLSGSISLSVSDVIFTGKTANDFSGSRISSAGDINGDGFDDILIGAHGANSFAGEAYLFNGMGNRFVQ